MPTETLLTPTTLSPSAAPRRESTAGRWLAGVIVLGLLAVGAFAATFLPGAGAANGGIGDEFLFTLQRGDMAVTVTEQGTLESSENIEIKCKVRGSNTVTWVIDSGSHVEAGDELVRLDTLLIEEEISERTKNSHLAQSAAERSKADVARAELAILEYEEGRFRAELMRLEKEHAIANSNLRTAQNLLAHAKMMAESGYVSNLEVEENEFAVTTAGLNVEVVETQIDVLQRFTKAMEMETLKGNMNAAKAQYEADKERAYADAQRRDRAIEELEYCVVRAPRAGMVIHPSAAAWEDAPQIEEGATVHKDQVLLLMPDLARMQIKVGVHESMVDRVRPGMRARVTLAETTVEGVVAEVSTVTRPAGWWTGNVVKYDTIIELPETEGFKPGMTAEVEVVMATHRNVVVMPVTAVVETREGYFCWVKVGQRIERRAVQLGDSNEMYVQIESGVDAGAQIVLDPMAHVEEAQIEAAKTLEATRNL